MFKHYKDICDVVSLLVYCPSDRSFLLTKESSGEYWVPSSKAERNCWKMTAHQINFELFGTDAGYQCQPLRVYKVWLPNHSQPCVYHAVFKVAVKADIKKRTKIKGPRNRIHWFNSVELERQRAHSSLRSPEVSIFAQIGMGEQPKDNDLQEMDTSMLIEVCEDNIIVGSDSGGGAVALASPNYALLLAANYSKEGSHSNLTSFRERGDRVVAQIKYLYQIAAIGFFNNYTWDTTRNQIRLYKEFFLMVFPALYMSPFVFTQFMVELGWQRSQCPSLFRAADVTGRGGLSFLETMLWVAALEPSTPHSGIPAEIRCRYIFRYFDSNRDMQLEYVEFKELVGAARAARQLPVDALSVSRDADVCLRALGLQPNTPLPLSDFLRGVGELRLRGTSSLLRAPRSIAGYLIDLQGRDSELVQSAPNAPSTSKVATCPPKTAVTASPRPHSGIAKGMEIKVAAFTVRLRKRAPVEMCELSSFDEDAVSPSAARLVGTTTAVASVEILGLKSAPAEALAAVHYFASNIEKNKRDSITSKAAWSWATPTEETSLGSLLLKLADAVRPICTNEPRLLRLASPVYAIGDLHGNLCSLLAMEAALWPAGPALAPARLMFLGDFVDRGPYGAELMAYLLAAKLQRPAGVLLVRGNHETRDIQKMFTFYNECVIKYGENEGTMIWNAINMVFDALPLAAVVDDKVFCCHGGIPPPWVCPLITAIDKVPVPLPRPAEQSSIAWELLWNDPVNPSKITATLQLELTANEGFAANSKRGTGHVFDQNALDRFLLANQLSHVLRAHQLHPNGFMCQLRGRLISVFSSSHYCGGTNDAAIALVEGGKLRLLRIADE